MLQLDHAFMATNIMSVCLTTLISLTGLYHEDAQLPSVLNNM